MLRRLRRRWKIIPPRYKLISIAVILAVLFALHLWLVTNRPDLASAVRGLLYLPLFMSALIFGLKGSLICAGVISLECVLAAMLTGKPNMTAGLVLGLEVGLVFVIGAFAGILADRERREATRMKQAESLALLGMTAATVAHELKNPLVAIGGFAQRIYRTMEPDDGNRRRLSIVVEQVAHMERLLRGMLEFSRPMDLRLNPLDINQMVREVLTMAEEQAGEDGISLEARLDPDLAQVQVDGARIKQVLLNLVLNAVQASPRGETVAVVTRGMGRDGVRISVQDNGCGISPEDREKVFLPFFTTKSKGTGLGLAVSHKIAQSHGGYLEVEGNTGGGSCFKLCLPTSPEKSLINPNATWSAESQNNP